MFHLFFHTYVYILKANNMPENRVKDAKPGFDKARGKAAAPGGVSIILLRLKDILFCRSLRVKDKAVWRNQVQRVI